MGEHKTLHPCWSMNLGTTQALQAFQQWSKAIFLADKGIGQHAFQKDTKQEDYCTDKLS